MKVFVDAYLLNKEYQGTRTYISELYKEFSLIDNSISITFGVNELTSEIKNEFKGLKNIYFYIYKSKNQWIRRFYELSYLSKEYDFMHFQYMIPFFKLNKKCKYINTVHDIIFKDFPEDFPYFHRLFRNILFRWSSKKADILLTVSNFSKKRIAFWFKVSENKIHIVANGVNNTFFKPYEKENISKKVFDNYKIKDYILYVSRIEPRKNHKQIIELFSTNKNIYENFNLVLIGKKSIKTNDIDKILSTVPNHIKCRIYFIEQVPFADLQEIYKACSFFVYPSSAEGFGIPPIEAAACKKPTLCNDNTAMSDFKFLSPYLVDFSKENINDVFNEFIMNNQQNLEKIQKNVLENYTWKKSAKKLYNILLKNRK